MLEWELRVKEFCEAVVQEKIDNGGLSFVDPSSGIILFYAGPSKIVRDAIADNKGRAALAAYPFNYAFAEDEADRLNAQRLDNTVIFPFLMSPDFKFILQKSCHLNSDEVKDAIKQVFNYISAAFARTDFRKAATLVCGADKDSTFYKVEMLGMLEGDHLKLVNERDADLFRDFRSLGKNEVHRLMAMTYLLEMKKYAQAGNDNKAWSNYRRQIKYFRLSRQEEKQAFLNQPQDSRLAFRQVRREILARYYKDPQPIPTKPSLRTTALCADGNVLPPPVSPL